MSRPSSPIEVAQRTFISLFLNCSITCFCSFCERPVEPDALDFFAWPINNFAFTFEIVFNFAAIVLAVSLNCAKTIILDFSFSENSDSIRVFSSSNFGCSIFCSNNLFNEIIDALNSGELTSVCTPLLFFSTACFWRFPMYSFKPDRV